METWKGKSKPKSALLQQTTLIDLFQRKSSPLTATQLKSPVTITNEEPEDTTTDVTPQVDRQPMKPVLKKRDTASPYTKPLHPLFTRKAFIASKLVVEEAEIIEVLDGGSNIPSATEPMSPLQDRGSQYDPIFVDSSPAKPMPTRIIPEGKRLTPMFAPGTSQSGAVPLKPPRVKDFEAPYPKGFPQHTRGPQGTFVSDIRYPHKKYGLATSHLKTPTLSSNWSWASKPLLPSPRTTQTLSDPVLNQEAFLKTIPDEHRYFHPAISRVVDSHSTKAAVPPLNAPPLSHKPWVEKWRPTRAAEVLGNEANALYLRDWLRALELHLNPSSNSDQPSVKSKAKGKVSTQGTKRPRIVRTVEKHRGRKKRRIDSDDDDNDDWIVASDAEVGEEIPQSDDILDDPNLGVNCTPNNYPSHVPQHSFNPLTNTILLVGPPGTGKTAAAYACAQELDWEVFEVYPGIGRRNGASIENMVGEVGKNHLVRKSKARSDGNTATTRDIVSVLRRQRAAKEFGNVACHGDSSDEPDTDFGFLSRIVDDLSNEEPNGTTPIVRQSVILLEEVDILFGDDAGFWPAVTNFIKNCKRPVICTCNDISLVPTQDLPLQTILSFQPCPPPIAASYLQGLCSIEGFPAERDSLLRIYSSTNRLDPIDIPNFPSPPLYNDSPVCDLRRTINHLELWCTSTNLQPVDIPPWEGEQICIEDLSDWTWAIPTNRKQSPGSATEQFHTDNRGIKGLPIRELAAYHADLISFVDSNLMRSVFDTPSALAIRSLEASANDEIGHPILYDPVPPNNGIEFNGRGEDIASTVLQSSRGVLEAGTTRRPTSIVKNSFRTHELFHARMSHQLKMAEVMQGFVPPSVWITARTAVYMDYMPCIRDIIATEDGEEAVFAQKERSGRSTRNSRGVYERTFAVSREVREALDSTLLG